MSINPHPSKHEFEKLSKSDDYHDMLKLLEHNIRQVDGLNTIYLDGTAIYQGFTHGIGCFIGHNTIIRENVTLASEVKIGSQCSIEQNVMVGYKTNIQAGCYIGENTEIGVSNFIAPHVVITSDKYPPGLKSQPVTIGDFNVIGAHSTILPGVTIGDYIIVGMGSRVTKDKLKSGVYIDDKYLYDLETYHKKRSGKQF